MRLFTNQQATGQHEPVWRRAVSSVFGAARRLHQYRDARDVLLQTVIYDEECHSRKSIPRDEQLR